MDILARLEERHSCVDVFRRTPAEHVRVAVAARVPAHVEHQDAVAVPDERAGLGSAAGATGKTMTAAPFRGGDIAAVEVEADRKCVSSRRAQAGQDQPATSPLRAGESPAARLRRVRQASRAPMAAVSAMSGRRRYQRPPRRDRHSRSTPIASSVSPAGPSARPVQSSPPIPTARAWATASAEPSRASAPRASAMRARNPTRQSPKTDYGRRQERERDESRQ